MYEVVSIIVAVFGVLQIVLFFKIWGMTNDVKNILSVLNGKDIREVELPKKAKVKGSEIIMDVVGIKNGKIMCRTHYSQSWTDDLYDFERLEFIKE